MINAVLQSKQGQGQPANPNLTGSGNQAPAGYYPSVSSTGVGGITGAQNPAGYGSAPTTATMGALPTNAQNSIMDVLYGSQAGKR